MSWLSDADKIRRENLLREQEEEKQKESAAQEAIRQIQVKFKTRINEIKAVLDELAQAWISLSEDTNWCDYLVQEDFVGISFHDRSRPDEFGEYIVFSDVHSDMEERQFIDDPNDGDLVNIIRTNLSHHFKTISELKTDISAKWASGSITISKPKYHHSKWEIPF